MTDYNHDPLVPRCGLAANLAAAVAYTNEFLWTTDTQILYIEQGGAKIPIGGSIGVPHNVLSATHLDSTPAACVRGDIITGQGVNPTWCRLAAAAVPGCYLASGTEPSWAVLNQAAIDGLTTASSPTFVTVKLTGLTTGYVPYHVDDATGLANSPIWTNATNVAIGSTTANGKLDVWNGNLTLSDTDVAHGMTDIAPTTVFGQFRISTGTCGGMAIEGFCDDTANESGLYLRGIMGKADPTDTIPAIAIIGGKANGTSYQALAATETVLKVQNYTTDLITVLGSGYVGVGCVPAYGFHVNRATDARILLTDSDVGSTATDGSYLRQFGVNFALVNQENGTFQLGTNNAYFMTVSASGNVGFNTTDIEAWGASYGAIEFGTANALMYQKVAGADLYFGSNFYYDGAFKYKTDNRTSLYCQDVGTHIFYTNDTHGPADAAITWITALTIGPTGGVHVGGTSDPGDNNLLVDGTLHVDGAATLASIVCEGKLTVDHIGEYTGSHGVVFDDEIAVSGTVSSNSIFYAKNGAGSNAKMAVGFTADQGTNDDEIFALKSSDVTHTFTDATTGTEADTYGFMKKYVAASGGLSVYGVSESNTGLCLIGGESADDTTTSTAAVGCVNIDCARIANNILNDPVAGSADNNLLCVRGKTTTRFIVKADGDIYYDGADQGAYDSFDDALACQDLSMNLSNQFGKVLKYNKKKLHEMGVIAWTPYDDGKEDIFVSRKGMDMLSLGAIGELYRVCNKLCDRMGLTFEEARVLQ